MNKLTLTDIRAEILNINTIGSNETEFMLSKWIIEYEINVSKGHFWRGTLIWQKRDCIIDDVIAAIEKDLPK